MGDEETIRVLLAKTGLDIHDVGVKVLATSLRDAGMEVIYTGLFQTPEKVVAAATQEDVDVIGISIVVDPAVPAMTEMMEALKRANVTDIPVIVGGRINRQDIPKLKEFGVAGIFRREMPISEIVESIREIAAKAKNAKAET